MPMARVVSVGAIAATGLALLWLACSSGDDDEETPGVVLPKDTLYVTVPELSSCDSASVVPEDSCRAWLRQSVDHGVDHFSVAMLEMAPLIKAVTSGPSFSSDIGAFLDTLAGMDSYISDSIYGKFVRCSTVAGETAPVTMVVSEYRTGTNLHGLWHFDSLGPPILYFFINQDPDMQASVRAMTTDPLGRPVLYFEFDSTSGTLRAMLNRRSYGNAAVEQLIDSICYNVRISSAYDSVWLVCGNVSHDSATVRVDAQGNLHYAYFGDRLVPADPYTYYLRPTPAQCPDTLKAPWWEPFIIPNRTCP